MSPIDEKQLKAEILKASLEHYRSLETWGSSLFLGAIALIGQQFVGWEKAYEDSNRVVLEPAAAVLPAAVGLTAFVFLRIVNHRGKEARRELLDLAKMDQHASLGWLGWMWATMPLAFGHALSWYLAMNYPDREILMERLDWAFGVALVWAFIAAYWPTHWPRWARWKTWERLMACLRHEERSETRQTETASESGATGGSQSA